MNSNTITYIDLFAGLGGTRIGLEAALERNGLQGKCVFTSEIKDSAIQAYVENFGDKVSGDIQKIEAKDIPDFDFMLAGFPCQPFSSAGVRRGFLDTRGTLFFDIERILLAKKPKAFLLENVEGLTIHDRHDKSKKIGRTLETILAKLEGLGYKVSWKVIDASEHGVPQKRKRIYIAGSYANSVDLDNLPESRKYVKDILDIIEDESRYLNSDFTRKLLEMYSHDELYGKQIKDKRGGNNNIHSWDIGVKGEVSRLQKQLLETLLKQRRRKSWASNKGISWSDGMPLTLEEIYTFFPGNEISLLGDQEKLTKKDVSFLLKDLVKKGYLKYELPKKIDNGYDLKGYNIVVGKLSFEISNILDPNGFTPTLVATDANRLAVVDKLGLRRLTIHEGLKLFGFSKEYKIPKDMGFNKTFDLLGNSVCVNVIDLVADRTIKATFL